MGPEAPALVPGVVVFAAALDFQVLIGGLVLLGLIGGALGLLERFLS